VQASYEQIQRQIEDEARFRLAAYKGLPADQFLIEGPDFDEDFSYPLIEKCLAMKRLEKGV